ncbi:hypothetical protein HEP87_19260 [Streptomyces sp. S1D4-11]|nr:hypothetical protein [Streptomyces sp. S1D4-11]QIY95779.1 hypothetical protein HEP87_19260 [Streptomyces sp. S1D4-11]
MRGLARRVRYGSWRAWTWVIADVRHADDPNPRMRQLALPGPVMKRMLQLLPQLS